MVDLLKDWINQLLTFALSNFDTSIADAAKILSEGFKFADANALAVSTGIKTFASTILVIACLIELCIGAAKVERLRWEDGVKIGTKLCLGKVCVELGSQVLEATYLQTQNWISVLGNPTDSDLAGSAADCIDLLITRVEGMGGALGLLASSLIMVLAIIACGMLIKIMAYARIFELYAYVVVSPLPLAFAPLSGGGEVGINNITKRFLKSYAGVCLQGVMMLVCLKIFENIIETALVEKVSNMYTFLSSSPVTNDTIASSMTELLTTLSLGSIALVVAVSKSGSWAKGIMDGA